MFEKAHGWRPPATQDVVGFSSALRSLAVRGGGADGTGKSAGLVDQIRALEELKAAAAAAQARATAAFVADQRAEQRTARLSASKVGTGIAAQVALARRDGPATGSRHVGVAEALVNEMPQAMAALEAGQLSEFRATIVVRETACLSREHRGQVDAELAARPGGLAAMGTREIGAEARRIGYRLDPHAVTDRAAKAESERRVTLRPAPDTMTWLTGLLPAKQGVAALAALSRHADSLRAQGDPRTRGQIMSDTLVERVTGQKVADKVPVEVHLVMTDRTLLRDGQSAEHEPAELDGYGPVPAPLARRWLRDTEATVWLRRLFTRPADGALVSMDSVRRCFEGKLRRFVIIRDRRCRTPWCDAPIRHVDHPVPVRKQGRTTARNGQGLCEACNYAKEAPGWGNRLRADGTVQTTTPTGHRLLSAPPPAIGRPPPTMPDPPSPSRLEAHLRAFVLAH